MERHLEKTATEAMQEQFGSFRKALAEMSEVLDNIEDADRASTFKDGIFCFELSLTFYEQANSALQAGAWFAASAIASSALESSLLSKCCFLEADVRSLAKFRLLFEKNYKSDYGLFIRAMDLGKLLEIANALHWFPEGGVSKILTSQLARNTDERALSDLVGLFKDDVNVGQTCAAHVKEYRNLLHPAVCLREGRQPSAAAGMIATLLFLIAFTSLSGPSD